MTAKKILSDGAKLKQVRKSLDMTQKEFGAVIDRDQPAVNKYEANERPVPSEVVKVLNNRFGISFDWWYNDIPTMKKTI